ncbi:hypothetical protein CPT_Seuss88 [Caulobacter phage Seuss]|uniref:Uncharacterized protein n=1 Tax=Caulobacter phage Seuss TaxID=1675601 RepID=A0A0K1LMC0_9CAUD|nr:hypothetical protein HOR08_gp088 [Caulobacter phage Seuss]AKU43614.1 hypothetical protein CPT_Seuss88 [Caulobacter phage Seuss]
MLITKIDDNTFELTHIDSKTPPMNLSKDKVREFLLAFKSPAAKTKPFGADKLIWAPTSREAIGIWISAADGSLSVWFQGEQFPITQDQVDQLILNTLALSAQFQAGQVVELTTSFEMYVDPNNFKAGYYCLPVGLEAQVVSVSFTDTGEETYHITATRPENGATLTRLDCHPSWIRPVRPLVAYNCIESGQMCVARNITIKAKSEREAQEAALIEFGKMPRDINWYKTGYVERDAHYYSDITAETLDHQQTAAAEGWTITKAGKIGNLKGGPFTSAQAAYDFVVRQALAGSNIHRHALAQVLSA